MLKYIGIVAIMLLSSSCINRQLGYFEVSPYAQVKSNKIDQPLYVRYSSRINDTYVFKQPGFNFIATELHKSYLFASQRAFADLFSEVRAYMPTDVGFILEIQKMEPRWTSHTTQTINQFKDTFEQTDIWCEIEYASSMYRNELLVSQASGTVVAKESELNTYKPEDVFKEAIKRSFAQMAQSHLDKM